MAFEIERWLKRGGPPDKGRVGIIQRMNSIKTSHCQDFIVLDTDLKIRLSTNTGKVVLSDSSYRLAQKVLKTRETAYSAIQKPGGLPNPIYIDLLSPLAIDDNEGKRIIGLILLRIDPFRFLYPFIQSWPTPSRTAETLLVTREGNEAVFLNELRFRKNTALNFRLPIDDRRLHGAMAALGKDDIAEGIDYRNEDVLYASRHIPNTEWFLIAKIDQAEAYASIQARAWLMTGLTLAALLAAGMWTLARWHKQSFEALVESQRQAALLADLLEYSSQPFRLDDPDGHMILSNSAYYKLLGYAGEGFIKPDLVGDITPPEWIGFEQEVLEALRSTGLPVRYEKEFLRKDGTRVPVELFVHLRKNENEHPQYYFAFITDITERRQTEEERNMLISELQRALSEVKTLSGLLPICASCKKIRDDNGYWNILESYISKHSQAEFTHGICPDCAKKLYPSLFKEDELDE
ncbi:MAG: PAS domain S-box protein [Deltaproteobacteria bacterium]|nr:PAS domain S-box protein [Deltaproteobacteria bacterium]